MICPKCNSNNISFQAVNEVYTKHGRGIIWWICIGWWWVFIKWIVFTIPAIIKAFFFGRKKIVKSKTATKAVCQNCGHMWTIK